MNGKLLLLDKNKDFYEEYDTNYSISCGVSNDYEITIFIDQNTEFENIINKTDELKESVKSYIDYYELEGELSDVEIENQKFLKAICNKEKELLVNAEYIEIGFSIKEIISYIKKNTILKNKKNYIKK